MVMGSEERANINYWVQGSEEEWNSHVSRMSQYRIIRISLNKSLIGKRGTI